MKDIRAPDNESTGNRPSQHLNHRVTSLLYNNFLGHGEFTDLALIGKYRQQVLSRGKDYQGPPISAPDEETKKITQQFTATILQVTLGAIREALDPESIEDGSSPLLRSNSAA